jgi:hypothetical protein
LALLLASFAVLAIFAAAGFAMGNGRKGAAISLIMAGASCLIGAALSLLGWQDKAVRQIAASLGLLANLGFGVVVIIFALSFRW